ncbi:MAG: alcohol dehydrogenase catalytic domain-containing protein, partial [Thermoanaerobaculia bacterium]
MRALTFQGIEQVRLRSIPDPLVSGDGDVIVRTGMTAICGSDLHVYHGREKGLDRGTVLGHEFMGEIIEVGSAVERFRIGDRVLSPFSTSCGSCFYCKSGLTARCEKGQLFGWREGGRGLHGAQAEFVRVPLADSTLVHAPEDLPPEVALLAGDVLSTGLFSAESADIGNGSVVGVVGCG